MTGEDGMHCYRCDFLDGMETTVGSKEFWAADDQDAAVIAYAL
jgi:hypothetical protein